MGIFLRTQARPLVNRRCTACGNAKANHLFEGRIFSKLEGHGANHTVARTNGALTFDGRRHNLNAVLLVNRQRPLRT